MVIVRSLERGISLSAWDVLTFGMILDVIITYNNLNADDIEEEPSGGKVRLAGQADFDRF